MVGAVWYLAITSVLSLIQHLVERALARSERRSAINTTRVSRAVKGRRQLTPQEVVHVPLA